MIFNLIIDNLNKNGAKEVSDMMDTKDFDSFPDFPSFMKGFSGAKPRENSLATFGEEFEAEAGYQMAHCLVELPFVIAKEVILDRLGLRSP